jgi:trigger factor
MVAQQYGPQVRTDVITDAVQQSFNDAVREQNLRVAGNPRIEPATGTAPSEGSLEFSAVFEVYPEIKVGDVSSGAVERPQGDITAQDIDRTVDVLRRQRATWSKIEGPIQAGDRAKVDFTGTIDGVEFPGGQAKDFDITLGEARMLPEFETALAGMKVGETKSFDLTFPVDYHGKDVAGKTARFALTVTDASHPTVPVLDSAFATAFGIKSGKVEDLRAEVEANLKLELKRKIESVLRDQAMRALREKTQITLPKSLVEQESVILLRRMATNLVQQGMKAEDVKLDPGMFRTQAEERVALGLIIGELVRTQNLSPKPEQVKAMVQEIAQTYEQPEAVIRWHYEKPERLADFEAMAIEHNVIEWVLGNAQVKDVPTPFEALMAPRA